MRNLNIDWWAMFQMLIVVVVGVLFANYLSQQITKGSKSFNLKKIAKKESDDTTIPQTTEKGD